MYQRTDPAVFSRDVGHSIIFHIAFRDENRIGIECTQHRVDPLFHQIPGLYTIHVIRIHVAKERGENVEVLADLEIVVFGCAEGKEAGRNNDQDEGDPLPAHGDDFPDRHKKGIVGPVGGRLVFYCKNGKKLASRS